MVIALNARIRGAEIAGIRTAYADSRRRFAGEA
jgi:hypothetical protein